MTVPTESSTDPPSPRRRARATAESDGEERPRRAGSRGRAKSGGSKIAIYAIAGVLLLGGAFWFTTRSTTEAGNAGETDLTKVMASFEKAWNAGELESVKGMFHPQKASTFGRMLEAAREGRGWGSSFVTITESKTPSLGADAQLLADGTGDAEDLAGASNEPVTSVTVHRSADGDIRCFWQFSAVKETWFMYSMELPPPAIEARLDGFDAAWNAGQEAGMRPFLSRTNINGLLESFAKVAKRREWDVPFVKVTRDRIEEVSSMTGSTVNKKVHYSTERGPAMFRWSLDRDADTWFIESWDPPNG